LRHSERAHVQGHQVLRLSCLKSMANIPEKFQSYIIALATRV
jgi:hypothetical protein